MSIEEQKIRAAGWFREFRDLLCERLEAVEDESETPGSRFERKTWQRPSENGDGGGGEMSILRGHVFEKAGVNISTVHGEFSPAMREQIPGAKDDPRFWASGVSVVIHPRSPHMPTAHMNTRMLVIGEGAKLWFGGGGDLTPIYPDAEDTAAFHARYKAACDTAHPDYYPKFKNQCDEYFYLPHRGEPRGVGGVFYDYLNSGNWEADFAFTREIGMAFADAYPAIIRRHMHKSWTKEERDYQRMRRGRYVEFNLLYDRGTKFGLMTGGNVEAILMSLPPDVAWP